MNILPCPFCHGQALVVDVNGIFYVRCQTCPAQMGSVHRGWKATDSAIEWWNKRHQPPPEVLPEAKVG